MNIPHGVINQGHLDRKDDFLYRLSLKALILNESGEVLVVKEAGRTWWDLPGGGMDHNETTKDAIARELAEEINLKGNFTHSILAVDEPAFLSHANVWQVRLIFKVVPENTVFDTSTDSDEVAFINPSQLRDSSNEVERRIYGYFQTAGADRK